MRLGEIFRRLQMLFCGSRFDNDLDEEMRLHLELRQRRLEESQDAIPEPAAAARRRFGNAEKLREESRDMWGWTWLEQLMQDVRIGARSLTKSPAFTTTVIATLGLGIGATTAIFALVNGVLLRPLPFAEPERLVDVYNINASGERQRVSFPDLEAFRTQSDVFDSIAAYGRTARLLQDAAGNDRVTVLVADRSFFDVLGVPAALGRTFTQDDSTMVAVLSGTLWRQRFQSDPGVIGRSITLDSQPVTVIGVMPDTFQFPYSAASVLPGALPESRTGLWIPSERAWRGRSDVTARLKNGVTPAVAADQLKAIAKRLESAEPDTHRSLSAGVMPLTESIVGTVRKSLWVLFGAVALVLVIACANVINLMLVRTTTRSREVAVRTALGAGRIRLMRQFLTESLLLSLAGGVVGVLLAVLGIRLVLGLAAARIPRAFEIGIDWQVFVFLLAASLIAAFCVGIVTAINAVRADVQQVLNEAGGRASLGTAAARLRDGLIVAEVGLAFVLALAAGALMREFVRLRNTEIGFDTKNIVTFHITPRAPERDYYLIEDRVAQLPGVQGAGFSQVVPLQNWGWTSDFEVRGRPREDPANRPKAELRYVTPGYFRTLGIPVIRGRDFTNNDGPNTPRVILINEALANRYFSNEDAIGRDTNRGTIIGIVGDVRQVGLGQPASPEIYYPAAQNTAVASDLGMSLFVKTSGPLEHIVPTVRSAVTDINRNVAIFNVRTMEQVISEALSEYNLYRWLLGLFAALALILATIGLYGVISYTATSRSREYAIRLALGSNSMHLARMVLGQGIKLALSGLVLGVIVLAGIRPWLADLPVTVSPAIVMMIAGFLFVVAALACVLPAMRVAGVNPMNALRGE